MTDLQTQAPIVPSPTVPGKGETVLITEPHLEGIAGVVIGFDEDNKTEVVVKLIDEGYKGALYQLPASSLVAVADYNVPNVLKLPNHDRLKQKA